MADPPDFEHFLGAGEAGARLSDAFLSGREDLPERVVMEIQHGSQPLPMVIGADPVKLQRQVQRYFSVIGQMQQLGDERLRRAAQFGLALDQSDELRREFENWTVDQGAAITEDLTALGKEVCMRLPVATEGILSIREALEGFRRPPASS